MGTNQTHPFLSLFFSSKTTVSIKIFGFFFFFFSLLVVLDSCTRSDVITIHGFFWQNYNKNFTYYLMWNLLFFILKKSRNGSGLLFYYFHFLPIPLSLCICAWMDISLFNSDDFLFYCVSWTSVVVSPFWRHSLWKNSQVLVLLFCRIFLFLFSSMRFYRRRALCTFPDENVLCVLLPSFYGRRRPSRFFFFFVLFSYSKILFLAFRVVKPSPYGFSLRLSFFFLPALSVCV